MTRPTDVIQQVIMMGNIASISASVNQMLSNAVNSQAILDEQLLPGMAIVCEGFKRNEIFLPQVLMSALLSSTMNNMNEILEAFLGNPEFMNTRLLIGGAPATREFFQNMGADAYVPTAPAGVEQVQHFAVE